VNARDGGKRFKSARIDKQKQSERARACLFPALICFQVLMRASYIAESERGVCVFSLYAECVFVFLRSFVECERARELFAEN
jgi:hypothetical protein